MQKITLLLCFVFTLQLSNGQTLLFADHSNEILIQFTPQTSVAAFLKEVNATHGFDLKLKKEVAPNWDIFLLEKGNFNASNDLVLDILKEEKQVLHANENRAVQFRNTEPNDPFFSNQWNMEKIAMPQVWDYTTGGQSANNDEIIVAVVDSGFNPDHPDFAGQIYETIDFASQPNAKHGTAVTGFIGAKGNNDEGITGVNWNIQLMLLAIENEDEIASAYRHIYEQRKLYNETDGEEGAFIVVVNNSFGFKNSRCNDAPILANLMDTLGSVGVLYIGAAPNEDIDINVRGDFPSECPSDFLISVTATTSEDRRGNNVAYGSATIDIGAPGTDVFTTNQSGGYRLEEGSSTSYATPHATGAVAILYSVPCEKLATAALDNPAETALLVKEAILKGVDEVPDLQNRVLSNGRLNVFNSMNYLHGYCIARAEETDFADTYLYDKDLVRIYPNPAGHFVTLDYAVTDFKEVVVKFYDATGRLLYEETTAPTPFVNQSLTVDISSWPNGIYFATVLGFEKAATQRFIKSN